MQLNLRDPKSARTLMILGGLGLASVFVSCAIVYFFVDPEPEGEEEQPAPMTASSSADPNEPDGRSSMQPINGEGISMNLDGAKGAGAWRAPDVGKVKGGGAGGTRKA
ncbi:MAG: hypothetical protein HY925_06455, partial [Elusimicrobia bacterium]|nr:hypothetical protein [Elusimicrobiota bacterium]